MTVYIFCGHVMALITVIQQVEYVQGMFGLAWLYLGYSSYR